jgi:hypothetical protein
MNGQSVIMLIDNKILEDHLIFTFIILKNVILLLTMEIGINVQIS